MFFKKKTITPPSGSLSAQTWKRFKRNKPALAGIVVITLACIISVLGYLITPDPTPYANDQKPELHIMSPGSSVRFLLVTRNQAVEKTGAFKKMLFGETDPYMAYPIYDYFFSGGDVVVEEYTGHDPNHGAQQRFNLANVAFALNTSHPVIYDSLRQELRFVLLTEEKETVMPLRELQKIVSEKHLQSKTFLLGTDLLGRDMLSRLLIGTRISLSVGLISVVISIFIGILLGALAGYFRGKTDVAITWLINVVWSIPTLLLVIAITLVLGKGVTQVFIAVGLTMWVDVARIVRGQVLSIREKEFVEAGRALGYKHSRIIFRHILPNVMGPVIVMAASNFATAILTEAGLSFLGIGAQPPVPSWGEMINAHHGYILMDRAYLAFIPGIAIMLLVLSFMMVGNGLRDAMDTRLSDDKPIAGA